ncbi:MAG: hypothetical protein H0U74_24055 [Bradymonadaceae bacterium]|nr:hypothetical protein [Lujinxingiaceae bacterium]
MNLIKPAIFLTCLLLAAPMGCKKAEPAAEAEVPFVPAEVVEPEPVNPLVVKFAGEQRLAAFESRDFKQVSQVVLMETLEMQGTGEAGEDDDAFRSHGVSSKVASATQLLDPAYVIRVTDTLVRRLPNQCEERTVRERYNCINEFFAAKLKGALFLDDARVDPKRLEIVLAALDTASDATVLGQPASRAYQHFGAVAVDYAFIYNKMLELRGRDQLLDDYRAAYAKNGDSDGKMVGWYVEYNDKNFAKALQPHEFDASCEAGCDKMIVRQHSSQHFVAVGFWLRRMADGTDKQLYDYLERHIARFDAERHAAFFANAKPVTQH